MIETNYNSSFPTQTVSDEEKASLEYGLKVGRAIEHEWFGGSRASNNRFSSNYGRFHQLRLYARGEQSIQKYKDELSINGDLSYLNLDWKPVPVIPKFVDIVVNGISQKNYDIKAFAQDPESNRQRTEHVSAIVADMNTREFNEKMMSQLGMDTYNVEDPSMLPENENQLSLYMQLDYKQNIEIAQEEVINTVLDTNKYTLTKRRLNYDLTTIGIAATKTSFNKAEGIVVDYVDPANLVYSYTEDPNFGDLYYVGEAKEVALSELKKEFPALSNEEMKEIEKMAGSSNYLNGYSSSDDSKVSLVYFEYKTYRNQVFKIKKTDQGLEKAIEKTDEFNPPENDTFKKVSRTIEVIYSGVKVLGYNKILKWELAENMTRPFADTTKVSMNYSICAPRMYKGKIESLVGRITGFADMIQLTHLKLQQVMSRIVPDGVFLDMDGLAEVDLGNGTSYNAAEALNMYFQTGSVVGRSLTQDGDMNRGKIPVQQLTSSSGQGKIASLINTYQYYLQMIRDVTGLNEARDGSNPDKNALVGLQKMAANQSNVATRHILQGSLYLTLKTCENISLKVADLIEFPLTRQSIESSISIYNAEILKEIVDLNLHDFGIFLELEPDDEEKQQLEQNIQIALQAGGINLEDAIDIRQIKNIKLANESIKFKRKKKEEADRAAKQANIQAQAQANAQAAEAAAMSEVQKQQALAQTKIQIEQSKSQFDIQKLQQEAEIKKQLMEVEFQYNMQLAQAQYGVKKDNEKYKEDRKDDRTKIQATQQSELIDQRKNDSLPKNFESAGFDNLGGFGLEQFEPR
jgi:hypothetical protein